MTVYASVPAFAERNRHPRALLLIVAGHAALLAAVITAKMDLPTKFRPPPTIIDLIPAPKPPPENPPPPQPRQPPSTIDRPMPVQPIPQPHLPQVDPTPLPLPLPNPGPVIGPSGGQSVTPERRGPRFITPESELKPPYPQSKLRLEEEAVLKLRLAIDDRGRVTAVDPVGAADPLFLAAARRHLIAHWRYKPASEGGRPVASSTVITLRFELND